MKVTKVISGLQCCSAADIKELRIIEEAHSEPSELTHSTVAITKNNKKVQRATVCENLQANPSHSSEYYSIYIYTQSELGIFNFLFCWCFFAPYLFFRGKWGISLHGNKHLSISRRHWMCYGRMTMTNVSRKLVNLYSVSSWATIYFAIRHVFVIQTSIIRIV